MEFDIKEYINLIKEYKFDEADAYRLSNVPNKVYKFIYLSESQEYEENDNYEKLNDIKINSIQEKLFWLSTYERLNDPFELKTLYIDESIIKKYNYPINIIENIQHQYLNGFLIACFTINNVSSSMPMWAHYANNHRGFYVEYRINKPDFFYPISYESERAPANMLYMNTISLIMKNIKLKLTDIEKQKLDLYSYLLFHNSTIKHKSWEYENEWRLLFPKFLVKKSIKVNEGISIPMSVLGIEPTGIYLGMCCEELHSKKLKKMANKLGIDIYRMNFNSLVDEYLLSYSKV
ncbi:MAG: DUF2971 domain-containing protein [Tissierellia bacterium]|nr:DUF2971 domain-containing protein [Tissierellia bacterium]